MTFKQLVKAALFLGSALLTLAVFLFTQQIITRLSEEVTTTSRVLARLCAQASFPATGNPELRNILSEVLANIDFPIVITDIDGTPRAWQGIGLASALVPWESIDSLQRKLPVSPVVRARIERVRAEVAECDRKNEPIEMTQGPIRLGAVHYGDPPVLERLRWMPFVSVAGVMLLLGLGLGGLAIIRQAEKRTIWVGMAKETAHQLGTPLSSLMGWVELLRSSAAAGEGSDRKVSAAEIEEAVSEMQRDLDRLSTVVQRFSRVGSTPQLVRQDVTATVQDVVQYMRRRMPQSSGDVTLTERYSPVPEVPLNPELIEWALENLISNALSALDKKPGVIDVLVEPSSDGRGVEVVVRDNGRGMSPAEQRRAFEPGYTSRRRGWGLGLPLARRVVQEYHLGKLLVRHSAPGQGTTMVIRLPAG